jgi:hypothetical protein
VNRDELWSALRAATIAAAATAGVLIGIGRRDLTAWYPFNVAASHVLGARAAAVYGFAVPITVVGILVHFAVVAVLSVILLALVRRNRAPLWPSAAGLSLFIALISMGLARRGTPALAGILPVGDLTLYFVLLAASLGVGMRFALPKEATR